MNYPISKLVQHAMERRGLRKRELAAALGYRSVHNGCTALTRLLKDGICTPYPLIHPRIASVLGIPTDEYERAVAETEILLAQERVARHVRREAEAHASFVPYLFAHTKPIQSRNPFRFFLGGKYIEFKEHLGRLPWNEQFRIVRATIVAHHERHQGNIVGWGRIVGYRYRMSHDGGAIDFSPAGELVAFDPVTRPELRAFGTVGGKAFQFGR